MSDSYTLGAMLRSFHADQELAEKLGPAMTSRIMKHSDLHAGFKSADKYQPAPFLQPESYEEKEGKTGKLAGEAAAFLKDHADTLIHDGLTCDCIVLEGDAASLQYPKGVYLGPFGYDTAALMASVVPHLCAGAAEIGDEFERDDFVDCCLDLISNLADQLIGNYDSLFAAIADAPKTREEDFKRTYFEQMMPRFAASVGLEVLRTLSGSPSGQVLNEMQDPGKRQEAENILLDFAEICIRERENFYFGADFAAAVERALRETKEH